MYIKDFLNKIKWDKRENPEDYEIFYFDRILKKLIPIKFTEILEIEGSFLKLDRVEETYIPLHRVRKIIKKGKTVWERNRQNEKG